MVIGMERQIVLHRLAEKVVAFPGVPRLDRRSGYSHQPIVLHVVDGAVQASTEPACNNEADEASIARDRRYHREGGNPVELILQEAIVPGQVRQPFFSQPCLLDSESLPHFSPKAALLEEQHVFSTARRCRIRKSRNVPVMAVEVSRREMP